MSDRTGDIELPVHHERTKCATPSLEDLKSKKRYSLPNYNQTGRLTPKFNAHANYLTKGIFYCESCY
jgi:hypothetical protein